MTTENNNTVETTPAAVVTPEVAVAPVDMPAAPMINIEAALGDTPAAPEDIRPTLESEAPVIGATHEDTVVCEADGAACENETTETIHTTVEEVAEVAKPKSKKKFNVPTMVRSAMDLSHDAMRAAFTPFKSSLARMLETSNNASIGNWLNGNNKLPDNYLEVVAAKADCSLVTLMVPVEEVAELEEKFAHYNENAIAKFVTLLDEDANSKSIAKQKREEEAAKKKAEKEAKKAAAEEEKAKKKAEKEAKKAAAEEEKAKKKAEKEAKKAAAEAKKNAVSQAELDAASQIIVDAPVAEPAAELSVTIDELVAE